MSASAALLTQPPKSVPFRTTGFLDTTSLVFDKFDPALGTLRSIEFTLVGQVEGSVQIESRSSQPRTVETIIAATLNLRRPDDNSILISLEPTVSTIDTLDRSDGVLDFAGASGRTHTGLTNQVSGAHTSFRDFTNIDLFIGTGTVALLLDAESASQGVGYGDSQFIRSVRASAIVSVVYNYLERDGLEIVPEPSGFVLMGIGAACALLCGHKRLRSRHVAA